MDDSTFAACFMVVGTLLTAMFLAWTYTASGKRWLKHL